MLNDLLQLTQGELARKSAAELGITNASTRELQAMALRLAVHLNSLACRQAAEKKRVEIQYREEKYRLLLAKIRNVLVKRNNRSSDIPEIKFLPFC